MSGEFSQVIKHSFVKINAIDHICSKCGITKITTVGFINGPKQKIKVSYNEFGCISDNEAIIKRLLE